MDGGRPSGSDSGIKVCKPNRDGVNVTYAELVDGALPWF